MRTRTFTPMWDDCLVDFVTGPERCVTHATDQHVDSLAAWLIKQMRRQDLMRIAAQATITSGREWATIRLGALATANSMEVTRET
jgi:hypothetical protein